MRIASASTASILAFAVLCQMASVRAGDMGDQVMAAAISLNAVPGQYEEVRRVAQAKVNPACGDCASAYQGMIDEWTAFDRKMEQDEATLPSRAQRQEDYLHFYANAAQVASATVTRLAEQANRSGPGGSLCGRCTFSSGGQTAPLTASVAVPRDQIVNKYVEIFWETNQESERVGFRNDDLIGKALRPFHRQSAASHKQESEKYVREIFSLMGERDARMLINEELRASWARQGSSQRFEQRYGSFLDSY